MVLEAVDKRIQVRRVRCLLVNSGVSFMRPRVAHRLGADVKTIEVESIGGECSESVEMV